MMSTSFTVSFPTVSQNFRAVSGYVAGFLLGSLAITSYAASAMPEVVPQQIYAHSICGDVNPTVRVVIDEDSLAQVLKGGRSKLGAPPIDFSQSYVLLISMGGQRTGGYALRYQPAPLAIDNGVAQLTVEWIKPKPGRMVIQMLTQPCLVLAVPKGPFTTLKVTDQSGRVMGEVQVN